MNKLQKAVIKQLGHDKVEGECRHILRDVAEHGADAGFSGFIYYSETCQFFQNNKEDIVRLAEKLAEELGEDVLSMVASFRSLHGEYSPSEIARVIYGSEEEPIIENVMAWFALEETAHQIIAS